MPTYVIAGASRGIGYGFITVLAADPENTVFGLVRNVETTKTKLTADNLATPNLHIIQCDISSLAAVKAAAEQVKSITPAIDILIINAVYNSKPSVALKPTDYTTEETATILEQEMELSMKTNVIGVTYTINHFLPLIREGSIKKIVALSSPNGDLEAVLKMEHMIAVPYSVSKAALQNLIAIYAVQLKAEGILAFTISPGFVATDATAGAPEERRKRVFAKWKQIYPLFEMEAATPEVSVKRMMNCIDNIVTMEQAGEHLSFRGDKEFL